MIVLGLETSCDETAAALVTSDKRVLAEIVLSQVEEHRPYLGVVPEIAARSHIDHLDRLIATVMAEAKLGFEDLDAIAATAGPGLIGGVMVGLMTAKGIALVSGKPLIAVNHLEGHALSARLTADIEFPYLLLLVSGGHCQLLSVEGVGRYRRLGTTIDDAVGEAFDKTAKMLRLDYPGGPAIERLAKIGNSNRFPLPRPMLRRPNCDFSFSGLKTAVRQTIADLGVMTDQDKADVAASFQAAVADILADRVQNAMATFASRHPSARTLVIAGGVAANQTLQVRLQTVAANAGFNLICPPLALCTDNGTMIAWAGLERLRLGLIDSLDAPARARWPLDPTAPPAAFAGAKA